MACVRQRVAEAGAIPHLVALLKVNDSFAQSQAPTHTHTCTHAHTHSAREGGRECA